MIEQRRNFLPRHRSDQVDLLHRSHFKAPLGAFSFICAKGLEISSNSYPG